jgi:hypothetical protein
LVAGCSVLSGPRTGDVGPPKDALAAWQDFPANANPRPIVLLSGFPPNVTFSSNDAKIAVMCGKFKLDFQAASDVPKQATVTWSDGTSLAFPAIAAGDAYAAMSRALIADQSCLSVAPLSVTAARFGPSGFQTDRGIAQMSAWLYTATGAAGEFAYPAIAPSAFWGGGQSEGSIGGGATVSADGRSLNFSFIGGPTEGPCAEDYSGRVAESSHAVAVAVESSPGRTVAGPQACDAVGHIRSVTVTLASPLGGRVVVDAMGAAVAVCPERSRGC